MPPLRKAECLDAYLRAAAARPFDWRENNCCHFAAVWVLAIEGRETLTGLAEEMGDEVAARRLIERLGGLSAAITDRLGREPIAAAMAQVGDVVLARIGEEGAAVGICCGREAAFLVEGRGVARLPMRAAQAAWRIEAQR